MIEKGGGEKKGGKGRKKARMAMIEGRKELKRYVVAELVQ